jgi:hypothetical protein
MKITTALLFLLFICPLAAQQNYNWPAVKKVELFYYKEQPYRSNNFIPTDDHKIDCNDKIISRHFKNLKTSPESFDHYDEEFYIIAKLQFANSVSYFTVFPAQGFMMNSNGEGDQYLFANKKQFKTLINKCISGK